MRTLRFRRIARAEIHEAFDWYRARSRPSAARFIDPVSDTVDAITADPERQRPIHGSLRRWLLIGFPYGVYYKVFPSVSSVGGVLHGSRHPDTSLRRAEP